MAVATNNILKVFSDLSAAADKIVEENSSEIMEPFISKWISLVKNKAHEIVNSESVTENAEIPHLMSFLKGSCTRRPRISSMFIEIQKLHLHRNSNRKTRMFRRSSKRTPLRGKSGGKGSNDTEKLKLPPENAIVNSASSVERKEETSLSVVTPVNGSSQVMYTSSKRKSSELSLEKVKKLKMSNDQVIDIREREKSVQNSKIEKSMKVKISSLLCNYATIKPSVGAIIAAPKENRVLRSKIETKQEKAVENRKNILALRQQKLQQNKRTRQEKMEKTLQQRMKLEKEKQSKLRSGTREKVLTNSNKEVTPRTTYRTVLENETLREASNSTKSKEKGKQVSIKELQTNLKKIGTSVFKSSEKTPINNNSKHGIEMIMNATYIATGEQPSTSSKGDILKKTNIYASAETIKDVSNDKNQTHTMGTKTVSKGVKKLFDQKKQLICSTSSSTQIQKKGPESYAMTPARSSFVSYDISEIRSDSEEEEQEVNSKPIPSWATGVRLRNALLQQHHHPIDSDELFGNFFNPPDLAVIMGIKKKQYTKRTSSAVWNSSFI